MKLQALLLVLVVQGSSGLRIRDKPILNIEQESESTFLPTLFRPDGKMAFEHLVDQGVPSSLKVVQTNADGNHGLVEVFLHPLSEEHKMALEKHHPKGGKTEELPGGFTYKHTSGTFKNGVGNFLKMLLTDLGEDKLQSLQKCGGHAAADPGNRGGGGVWLVLNGEKLSEEQLVGSAAFKSNNVLILGAPGKDVAAGKGRSIYVPGASLAFMEMSHTPMDFLNRQALAKEENHVYAYQHHNCKANRENFFTRMCEGLHQEGMECYALGKCGHNQYAKGDDRNNAGGRDIANRDDASAGRYAPYKFVEAFENSAGYPSTPGYSSSGYISEKITSAFLSGAVPVYAGADEVSEVFNPAALIEADPLTTGGLESKLRNAVSQMVMLERDPAKYKEMVTQDAVTEDQMKKFFSWHPATWATHGDGLRQRIVGQILSFCDAM